MPVFQNKLIYKHIGAIRHLKDGRLVVASSNLTAKEWDGRLALLADMEPQHAPACTPSGISSLAIYSPGQVALGLDSGSIQYMSTSPESLELTELGSVTEHDDTVSCLAVTAGQQSHLISGSLDYSIKIWDLSTMTSTNTYRPAHGHCVWSLAASPQDSHAFISSGEDGQVLLWDSRQLRPASLLVSVRGGHLKAPVTAVAWHPDGTSVALGDRLGHVMKADPRSPKVAPAVAIPCHQRALHLLDFSPHKSQYLATCADETTVTVVDWEKNKVCYLDDQHEDFVRGLSWHPTDTELLYSSGWDCAIHLHKPLTPAQ